VISEAHFGQGGVLSMGAEHSAAARGLWAPRASVPARRARA